MSNKEILKVENIHKNFSGLTALDGVSLKVRSGEITGLIGPNGSGKTTLFNIISGFLPADSGKVIFDGQSIQNLPPHEISRLGLYRTFQMSLNPSLMTVMENMLLTPQQQAGESITGSLLRITQVREQEKKALQRAWQVLEQVDISDKANTLVGSLSGGQKKLLSLAQALMLNPKLIMLDEPVAGVNPNLIAKIIDVIRQLQEQGHNFLIVEHNMHMIRQVCDQVYVLDAGQVLASGEPNETLQREEVLEAYLAAPRSATQDE